MQILLYVDYTAIVCFVTFLILLLILSRIFFKPMMEMFDRREQQVTEPVRLAVEINAQTDESVQDYQARMAQALDKAEEIKTESLKDASTREKEILASAREANGEFLAKMREEMDQTRQTALEQLRSEADRFGEQIAQTLLGRGVQ